MSIGQTAECIRSSNRYVASRDFSSCPKNTLSLTAQRYQYYGSRKKFLLSHFLRNSSILQLLALFIILHLCTAAAAKGSDRYHELDKTFQDSLLANSLDEIRRFTVGPPKRFHLTALFDHDSDYKIIADSVVRIDLLYSDQNNNAYDNFCTGTIIDLNTLITAAHCFFNRPGATLRAAKAVFGYEAHGAGRGEAIVDLAVDSIWANRRHDIATAKLAGRIPASANILQLRVRQPVPGETLFIISHPLGQPKRLSTGFCVVRDISPVVEGQFSHSCATYGGSSGALILAASDFAIVGVHSRRHESVSIGHSLIPLKHQEDSGPLAAMIEVPVPANLHTSGSVVSIEGVQNDFAHAIVQGRALHWLALIVENGLSLRAAEEKYKLAELSLAYEDWGSFRYLASDLNLGDDWLEQQLHEMVRKGNSFRLHDISIIGDLLYAGAKPRLSASTGQWAFCGPDVRAAIREIFAEHGYPQSSC